MPGSRVGVSLSGNHLVVGYLRQRNSFKCKMHELSIALDIIDIARRQAERHGATFVRRINMRVGPLSGVVPDALAFSFATAAEETAISGAVLHIDEVPLTAWCGACAAVHVIERAYDLHCPVCGSPVMDVWTGSELEITSMEIE